MNFIKRIFVKPCAQCEKFAEKHGRERQGCLFCNNPRTHEGRKWLWKNNWLANKVYDKNYENNVQLQILLGKLENQIDELGELIKEWPEENKDEHLV